MDGLFNVLAFRYQVSLILFLTLGLTFGGLLLIGNQQLDQQVSYLLSRELDQDAAMLLKHMAGREAVLRADAQALAAHAADLELFTLNDAPLALDELRRTGILPLNGAADYLFVMREDGIVTRASVPLESVFVKRVAERGAIAQDNGMVRSDWLKVAGQLYQISGVSVPGQAPARGTVFAMLPLNGLESFAHDQVGMVIFDPQGKLQFTSPINFDLPRYQDEFTALFLAGRDTPQGLGLTEESFAYLLHRSPPYGMPPFMLVYPARRYLAFAENAALPLAGLGMLVLGLILLLLRAFNRHTRQVMDSLLVAVEQVERENYSFRLSLPKHDELAQLADSMNEMLKSLEKRARWHGVMERIVSREVAEQMLEGHLNSCGEHCQSTVLVADIRGFSALTRQMSAVATLHFLNDYLGRMSYCVDAHDGEVDSYQGDTLVAVFGLHQHSAQHIMEALKAALDMLDAADLFNLETAAPQGLSIEMSIGIASGEVIAGSIGSARRASYSVLGPTVNQAIRLQRLASQHRRSILVDDNIQQALMAHIQKTQQLILSQAVQLAENVRCYEVLPRRRAPRANSAGSGARA